MSIIKKFGLSFLIFFMIFGTSFVLFNDNSINYNSIKEEDNLDLKTSVLSNITFHLLAENGIPLDTSGFWLWIGWMGNKKDFGVPVSIETSENVRILVLEKEIWTIIFDNEVNLFGITEYNITCGVGNLTINLNARELGEFTLTKLSDSASISFNMDPNTSREFILEYGLYNATWLNTEDNSTYEYNFNMDLNNKEMTLNSIFYDINFTLSDQFLNPLNTSYYSLYIDGNKEEFGVIELNKENILIEVFNDDFNVIVFNETEYLFNEVEYNIISNVRKLTINLNAREIGIFTLTEQFTFNSINFTMDPYTSIEFILGQSLYNSTWLNTEDNSTTLYNFNMNVDRNITLNSIFYDINFTLSDQFLNPLDTSIYSLYINQTKEDFGVIELSKEDVLITVYDRFGIIGFNQTVLLEGLFEYNIIIPIYKLKIENLASEMGNFTLKEKITQKTYNFSLDPDSSRMFKLRSANYTVIWLNGENLIVYEYNINLTSDFILTLESIYYIVYFSIFNFDGIGLDNNFIRFYLNGRRSDFGDIELNMKYNNLLILDFFDNIIYNETVNLSGMTEWNIYVEMYNIEIRNTFSYAIDLIFERNNFTVNITIPAQFSLEYRFILGVNYTVSWYRSSDDSFIGSTEVEFTKENLIISFGVVASLIPNISKIDNILNWIIFTFIVAIISVLGMLFKYKKKIILYINKRLKRLDNE